MPLPIRILIVSYAALALGAAYVHLASYGLAFVWTADRLLGLSALLIFMLMEIRARRDFWVLALWPFALIFGPIFGFCAYLGLRARPI